jgi:hypothetical protein
MIWLIRLIQRIPILYIYLITLFRVLNRLILLEENRIWMRFLSCLQTNIPTINPLLFFLHHQPSSLVFSKEYSHLSWHHKHPDDKGNTVRSPSYKLFYRGCLSSPQGPGGTVRRLSSAHVNFMTSMYVLSVTCFAQMK